MAPNCNFFTTNIEGIEAIVEADHRHTSTQNDFIRNSSRANQEELSDLPDLIDDEYTYEHGTIRVTQDTFSRSIRINDSQEPNATPDDDTIRYQQGFFLGLFNFHISRGQISTMPPPGSSDILMRIFADDIMYTYAKEIREKIVNIEAKLIETTKATKKANKPGQSYKVTHQPHQKRVKTKSNLQRKCKQQQR